MASVLLGIQMPVLVREETIEINIKLEHVSVEVVLAGVRP